MALETPYVNMILYFLTYQDTCLRNRFITSKPTDSGRSHLHLRAAWLGRPAAVPPGHMGYDWSRMDHVTVQLVHGHLVRNNNLQCSLNFLIPQCPSVVILPITLSIFYNRQDHMSFWATRSWKNQYWSFNCTCTEPPVLQVFCWRFG